MVVSLGFTSTYGDETKRQGPPQRQLQGKSEIQGSLHCGGKSAAFGRDDVLFEWEKRTSTATTTELQGAKRKCRGSSLSASFGVRMTASVSKWLVFVGVVALFDDGRGTEDVELAAKAPLSVEVTFCSNGKRERQPQRQRNCKGKSEMQGFFPFGFIQGQNDSFSFKWLVFVGGVALFDDGRGAEDVEGGGVAAGGLEGDSGGKALPFCWLADWNKVVRLRPFADLFLHYGAAAA